MATCLLIVQYVSFELSYDHFNTRGDHIYRVTHGEYATTTMTTAPRLQAELPEVERATRIWPREGTVRFQRPGEALAFKEDHIAYTDGNFLQLFSFPLRVGRADEALTQPYWPLIFQYDPTGNFSVKLATGPATSDIIAQLETAYESQFPGNPFTYFFLDDNFNALYQADQQRGTVFGIFAGLAILIACLGLFGLTTLTIHQKTKEIGIRKILGASVLSILRLLCRDFAWLVVVAILVALPIIFWSMREWLKNYAFAIELSASSFVVPALVVVLVGLLTVGIQTLRAARANPVESLRYE